MNPVRLIARKRDGRELEVGEIEAFVRGFAADEIPDYQMAAMAMAIYLRGMTAAETAALTDAMLHSGRQFSWESGEGIYVDKHSTGGIGDKTSLILAPLLACCGLRVPMISGRGLGATGGTLDKLESIPGFRTDLSEQEIHHLVQEVGCVITGATGDLVPADRKLYALRDVTATVPSIALITASIMSKKLAEGLDALVLDVKFGSGAFMKTLEEARLLARSLVSTGVRMGVPTTALLTDMNQPLGRMAGNSVEVDESLAVLAGEGPADVIEATLELGAELLVLAGGEESRETGRKLLHELLASGKAMEKFAAMVHAQGGDLDAPRPLAPRRDILSPGDGVVCQIDTELLGWAIIELGGGRRRKEDLLDHAVGLEMQVRIGDRVEAGQPLATLRVDPSGKRSAAAEAARQMVADAIVVGDEPVELRPLIVERITQHAL